MNKIKCNTTKELESSKVLAMNLGYSEYKIKKDVVIESLLFPKEFETLWTLEKNASLTIHDVLSLENVKGIIKIISTDNTSLSIHLGISSSNENQLTIKNILTGSRNHSEIKIRVVGEENSHILLTTSGEIKKDTKENSFLEEVKYLNEEDSFIECIPELLVDSNDVEANHFVTIGKMNEEELFYLNSKGISKEKAKKLIRRCFIDQMKR